MSRELKETKNNKNNDIFYVRPDIKILLLCIGDVFLCPKPFFFDIKKNGFGHKNKSPKHNKNIFIVGPEKKR